jgi:hypothetical protein
MAHSVTWLYLTHLKNTEYVVKYSVLHTHTLTKKKSNIAHLFVEIKTYATRQQAGFGVLLAITCLKMKLNRTENNYDICSVSTNEHMGMKAIIDNQQTVRTARLVGFYTMQTVPDFTEVPNSAAFCNHTTLQQHIPYLPTSLNQVI